MSFFKKGKAVPVAVPAPRSVASITAKLHDTSVELEEHAQEQTGLAAFQKSVAERALAAADEHEAESELAATVARNIKALLGGA